ncbi:MAG: hypothetical protein FWC92_09800 [Defluviitaleaceae bacterium]|nr:hypothetical protein [Defluviitaleaceae bacterium]
MADIIAMDELETFVLEILAYRREQRTKTQQDTQLIQHSQPPHTHVPKRIECKQECPAGPRYIPPTIGRGWPHYKHVSPRRNQDALADALSDTGPYHGQHDIIPVLAPVVAKVLSRFGAPTTQQALDNLINHVIASAIELPPVSESIQTAEIKPWGRVALLQAVIELMIRISTIN